MTRFHFRQHFRSEPNALSLWFEGLNQFTPVTVAHLVRSARLRTLDARLQPNTVVRLARDSRARLRIGTDKSACKWFTFRSVSRRLLGVPRIDDCQFAILEIARIPSGYRRSS